MSIDDAYAQWGAENLVIEYMESHEGQWPRSWEDLQPLYTDAKAKVGGWTIEKFRGRIGIDFEADAGELRRLSIETDSKAGSIPFHVIWPRWTFSGGMGGGPDERLYWYFRMQAGLPGPEPQIVLKPPRPARS